MFEKLGGTYTEVDGYRLPNVTLPEAESRPTGIWGERHLEFLRQYHQSTYITLLTTGKLDSYLADIDEQANEMLDTIIDRLAVQEGITEQLKAENQMEWVRRMNLVRATAREIVMHEIILS
jgi:hypothetical protein